MDDPGVAVECWKLEMWTSIECGVKRSVRSLGMKAEVHLSSDSNAVQHQINAATLELSNAAKSMWLKFVPGREWSSWCNKAMKLRWPHACSEQRT